MMYPFMNLDDNTEIMHSEILENEKVKTEAVPLVCKTM